MDHPSPGFTIRRGLVPVLLPLLLFATVTACGKKGDPLPPLKTIPNRTSDLSIRQEGALLVLQMTYPATTTAGLALDGIDSVELLGLVLPEESSLPDARELEASAEEIVTLRGSELEAAITGSRIEIRLPLDLPITEDVGQQIFAVRTSKGEENSPLSNRVEIVPVTPPTPPSDLVVEAKPPGVQLSWKPAESVLGMGFEVYRRGMTERSYGPPLQKLGNDKSEFLDKSAQYGSRYFYTVRAIVSQKPTILSDPAGEREVDYQDVFAPPLPRNFVALAEGSRIRLRWDPPAADDVRGVILWRKDPGGDFRKLAEEPLSGNEYLDSGLAMGLTYHYRIQAVDHVGNESSPSRPVSVDLR